MPNIFAFAVLIVVAMLAAKPVAAGPTQVAVHIDESGAVVVPVHINGSGPYHFLLDTGSSHSVVSQSLAEQLALHFVAKTSVLTSTGREWRPVVRLDKTTIGGLESDGLLASVTSSSDLEVIAQGIDGIIGQDFLFAFNYTLDYRRHRLVWSEGECDAGDVRLPLIAKGGRYLVQIGETDSATHMLLVPDSGASGFVAYERDGRTKLAVKSGSGMTAVHSLSGGQHVRTMMLRQLQLGSLVLREQPVAVLARDRDDDVEGDGLLPLHLFASVSFNAREQCLVLRR
jgi:predicted aspartyl protease